MRKSNNNQPKAFDVHRTLPSHQQMPGHKLPGDPPTPVRPSHRIPEPEQEPKKKKHFSFKRAIAVLLLLILIPLLIIGVWDARNVTSASRKMFGSANLSDLIFSNDLKGSERGRVNVLLVGYSVDDPGHPAATLTDSILLLSMNTTNHTGYMLSIPRDLYINIPGQGYAKINEAFQDGNQSNFSETGYPAGGVGLLEKTISDKFQTPIDYYMVINYSAVRDMVNALGGVTVNIQSPDPDGLYDPNISSVDGGPLRLSNGPQTLNGQTALNLTRARGDPCFCGETGYGFPRSDFDRTEHQRQVFVAIKDKAANWKLIADPRKNAKLFNAAADNIKTDLTLGDVRPLYQLFSGIPSNSLQSLSLNSLDKVNLLKSYGTSSGQSALIPAAGLNNYSQIVSALKQYNN